MSNDKIVRPYKFERHAPTLYAPSISRWLDPKSSVKLERSYKFERIATTF
jgi:hypothetical protein